MRPGGVQRCPGRPRSGLGGREAAPHRCAVISPADRDQEEAGAGVADRGVRGDTAASPGGPHHRLPELLRLPYGCAEGAEDRQAEVPIPQGSPAGHPVHRERPVPGAGERELRLPKIGDVPVRWSRPLPSEQSSVTVIKDPAGRYFASFVIETEPGQLPEAEPVVGIDLGLKHFAILSDGRKITTPQFLRRAEKVLKRRQRELSRKQKGLGQPGQGQGQGGPRARAGS